MSLFGSVKVHDISPYIATYDNLLSSEECTHFRELFIKSNENNKCNILYDTTHITSRVATRISKIISMPIEHAEEFVIEKIKYNSVHSPRVDILQNDGSQKTLDSIKYGGNKVMTTITYINSELEKLDGGGTKFDLIDLNISANPGRLLVIGNKHGETDGLPVYHKSAQYTPMSANNEDLFMLHLGFKEAPTKKLYQELYPDKYNAYLSAKKCHPPPKPIPKPNPVPSSNYTIPSVEPLPTNNKPSTINILSELQIGDFLPFFKITGLKRSMHLQKYVTSKDFVIVTHKHLKNIYEIENALSAIKTSFNIITVSEKESIHKNLLNSLDPGILYTQDVILSSLLKLNDTPYFYILTPNRQLRAIYNFDEFKTVIVNKKPLYTTVQQNAPHMMTGGSISTGLNQLILNFFNSRKNNNSIDISRKNGNSTLLNKYITEQLDNKFAMSLVPEIRKVFGTDIYYREPFKLYAIEDGYHGPLMPARRVPGQYSTFIFLRCAMQGGSLILTEYQTKLEPYKNCAITIPGICAHQIEPVDEGTTLFIATCYSAKKYPGFEKINIPLEKYLLPQ